jgi:hypothetical protein
MYIMPTTEEMLQVMMAKMEAMEKANAAQGATISALKNAQEPEGIVSSEEMSQREVQHNAVTRKLIEHRKEKLREGLDYGTSEDAIHLDDNDKRNETYRDVLLQVTWSMIGGSKRQYMYNRYRTDQIYLWMNDILEKDGGSIGRHSDGIIGSGLDTVSGIDNANKEYMKAESQYQYFSSTMNTYEILCIAAKELWFDAQEEKEEAWIELNKNDPNAFPPRVKEPDWNISDAAYAEYMEGRTRGEQQEQMKRGQRAMEASRMLRLTNRCDFTDPDTK